MGMKMKGHGYEDEGAWMSISLLVQLLVELSPSSSINELLIISGKREACLNW
jgi:hypothetical protein